MAHRYYPAVFHGEESGFSVSVPDLAGCFTEGETLEEAHKNCIEAIGLYLSDLEKRSAAVPEASDPHSVRKEGDDFVVLVEFDISSYKRRHDMRSVKKTLTIPSWLNEEAEARHVNFSGVLQSALKEHLGIND